MTSIHREQLGSGLWVVGEQIPGVRSLAVSLLLPSGIAREPEDRQGVATTLSEMIWRGAGERSAREHSDALDRLGVQRSSAAQTDHFHVGMTMIGEKFADALPLLADCVLRPTLDDDAFGPSRDLSLQALDALEDEPQQRVLLELRHRHQPAPFGRSSYGRREDLEALTTEDVRAFRRLGFVPGGAILGVAGCFEWEPLLEHVRGAFGEWTGSVDEIQPGDPGSRGRHHVTGDTTQVHLALAYDAPPAPSTDRPLQAAAAAVLSGGMSSRLFTEVREKRGLCYSVYATYAATRDRGAVMSYAGTTVPRAQETLDVVAQELTRLSQGADASEFDRAIVGMKSRLVMQGESTGSRAAAIASDQYVFGRPRPLDERAEEVDAITLDRLNAYLADHPPGPMTLVTIGPEPLRPPAAVDAAAPLAT